MDGADQRVGDPPFVKTGGGGINLRKLGIIAEGGSLILLGLLQHHPGCRGFPHTRWPVNNHMLGIGAAQRRLQSLQPFLLPDNIG
ncbi:hypothetical protein D3C72_2049010 [compost metagenome]